MRTKVDLFAFRSNGAGASTRPFGPIDAELFKEEGDAQAFPNGGIKYTIDLPDEWSIDTLPGPLRVVGRGLYATAVEAELTTGEKVVVLVRPLEARLPHEHDCQATRWTRGPQMKKHKHWMEDCMFIRKTDYAMEMSSVVELVRMLANANLLPTLYHYGIVSGSTEHDLNVDGRDFQANEFGVQVWKQMTTTVADYIKKTNMTREHFKLSILPKIEEACEKLAQLGMFHYDPHLDNVAFDIDDGDEMSNFVFLDPSDIKPYNGGAEYDHMTSFDELKQE